MLEWASLSAGRPDGRTSLGAEGFGGPDFIKSIAIAFHDFRVTDIAYLASGMKIPARVSFLL
jgi:hypothetical protein